jgi:hypothetical protein
MNSNPFPYPQPRNFKGLEPVTPDKNFFFFRADREFQDGFNLFTQICTNLQKTELKIVLPYHDRKKIQKKIFKSTPDLVQKSPLDRFILKIHLLNM